MSASRFRSKPVPFLLESFPVPPSFIPNALNVTPLSSPNPLLHPNPPPTLPPTSPLPPLPGPSPISDEETIMLLSSSHLRRLSRLSTHSATSSKRDSTATIASVTSIGSNGVPSLSPSISASSSSTSQSSSLSRTRTESGDLVAQSLHSFSSNSSLSLLPYTRSQQQPNKSPRLSPTMKVAIREEDQTLSLRYSHMDPEVSPLIPAVVSVDDSIASIDMRDLPSDEYSIPVPHGRASPDIRTILSATPKPRRRTTSTLSSDASKSAISLPTSEPSINSPSVTNISQTIKRPDSSLSQLRRAISSSLGDADDDGISDFDELERELEGDGSESDSSLDLHTPFAHVMLRDGLISPRSKLIAAINPEMSRPGSVLSTNVDCLRTKSGVYKDDRDTLKRRHRHRDGNLLKAGMGLTTGLGWSDSEDEDSPSPLTRRLSNMAMSRKSSSSSIRSTRSAPAQSVSRTSSIASDYVPRTLRRTTKSSKLSVSSSSSWRLPTTLETIEDAPLPIPPPKDIYPIDTKDGDIYIHSAPVSASVASSPSVSGRRPLKLSQNGSVLRSSSLGQVNVTSTQGVRQRTYSQPLNIKSGLSAPPPSSFKSGLAIPRKSYPLPSSTTPSSPPDPAQNSTSDLLRKRSRIGTGMVYKRSTNDLSVSTPPLSLASRSTVTSAPALSVARRTVATAAPSANSNSQSTPYHYAARSTETKTSVLSPPTRGMGGGGSMNLKRLRMPSSPNPLGSTLQQGRPGMSGSMLRSPGVEGVELGVAI